MTDTVSTEESENGIHEGYAESSQAAPDDVLASSFPENGRSLQESPLGGSTRPAGAGASGPGLIVDESDSGAGVRGRIKVADEVVEKVAALAALEVMGVADLGGDFERALESVRDRIGIGAKRPNQGVRARIDNRQVAVDVTIVIEYGHIVMEVAGDVKVNVARTVSHMLGMRVVEVNVTVDDVRLPDEERPAGSDDEHAEAF
ncbi:Asp23/Gls24 family envelope stress response protein [Sphaerisporangium perillae]|uniref:Asp23/Gls24 family envelope stress response protein n=1 Tax=Sphaerisporangium perillae TaxID=2935860 RepID=UPI00200DCC2F|nr:Asp23/Gls24 family envelope stress response protein [Sphaerisporangium perillae]